MTHESMHMETDDVMVNVTDFGPAENDVITMNVGGIRYETHWTTLFKFPNTLLANLNINSCYYRKHKSEYFFDRSPTTFEYILNYYRVGELHLPKGLCSIYIENELAFWGINPTEISPCCWLRYKAQQVNNSTLIKLDNAHRIEKENEKKEFCSSNTGWHWLRPRVSAIFENPWSSLAAKVYVVFSILFVLLSVFTYCAETHDAFKKNMTLQQYAHYQGVTPLELVQDWEKHSHPAYLSNIDLAENAHLDIDDLEININGTHLSKIKFPATNKTRVSNIPREILRPPNSILEMIDYVCYTFFTLEVIARFIFCPSKKRFMMDGMNILDAASVVLFYIEIIIHQFFVKEIYERTVLDFLFFLRILRILRVFRLGRHHKGLRVLVETVKNSLEHILVLILFICVGVLFFSALIFYTDGNQGEFKSIPHCFWWAIVTMTTLGYGDMVPTSALGKIVGSVCAVVGVLLIAFTVPIIVSNFTLLYDNVQFAKSAHIREERRRSRLQSIDVRMHKRPFKAKRNNVVLDSVVTYPLTIL